MTTEATPGALGSNDQLGLAPERAEATPPAAWDEWAMRRASRAYDSTVMQHMGNDSRCRAAIHVALIDAMRYATEAARAELSLTQRAWREDSNAKALEIAKARRTPLTQDAVLDLAEGCTLQCHDLLAFARAVERAHGIEA